MKQKINFSLVQADLIWENSEANLQKFDETLRKLPKETEIVIFPEMFSTGFTMNVHNLKKPIGYTAFEWMQRKANELQKILIGSILFEQQTQYYNRMFWVRPDGSYDYYDKRHLFHQGAEDQIITAGLKKTIVNYKGIKFLLQICYDLRFPVWSKNNYDIQTNLYDYDAIIYIANWPESRKKAYQALLKARSIENQAKIFWVNRIGKDGKGINHSGDTQVVDEQGSVFIKANENEEVILNLTVDFTSVFVLRDNFKVGLDWDKFKIL